MGRFVCQSNRSFMPVHRSTLQFLRQLEKNNNREWFQSNRKAYETARVNVLEVIAAVLDGMSAFDPGLAAVEPASTLFRINRDVRFSNDKSPYKTNFGAVLSSGGKKSPQAGYYLHLEAGSNSIAGGGVWMPDKDRLAAIRQEIDYNLKEFESILEAKNFKKYFGELSDEKLKTRPKGYAADHPGLEHLKQKSYVAFRGFSEAELQDKKFEKEVVRTMEALLPLNEFLNRAMD